MWVGLPEKDCPYWWIGHGKRRRGYRNGVVLLYSFGGNVLMMSERPCCDWSMALFDTLDPTGIYQVRSNSWDAQLAVPNDPRYARLETNRAGQGRVVTVRRQSCDILAV
ncbi:hypothetical protein TNCV_1362261 [Trichonephila clavipes]|nr:hypothetical protein TNCV_1362261 [Trichonephila clavipes]